MSLTVDQLFYGAYSDAGMIEREGTILNPDETEQARQSYNRMVDAWRLDGLMIEHVTRKLYDILADQSDYSIGPSGDWDTVRPVRIEQASLVLTDQSPNPEYPLYILTPQEWQLWTRKEQAANWPSALFYEKAGPPLGIVHLLFVPSSANKVALYEERFLLPIEATGDELLDFAPGYQEAIETNLAVRIAAKFPRRSNISMDTKRLAISSVALVRNNNNRPLSRSTDFSRTWGRSNVYDGTIGGRFSV